MKDANNKFGLADDPDGSMFETGDQDYASAAGWEPPLSGWKLVEALDRKKNPRKYAPKPEMLYVREAQYYIENASKSGTTEQLFGPFWLLDEVSILYAPPGVGKSALATQIAESLARGVPFAPFENPEGRELKPQRVLYLDFELTRWQFTQRYTCASDDGKEREHPYQLSPNLLRAELYW